MTFATIVTIEAITAAYHRFVFRYEIEGEIDTKFEILKKEVVQELHLFLAKSTDELSEVVAKRLAGTTHIVAAGIVNVLEGFDLQRVLGKCHTTTLFLSRFYFSAKEFELLESSLAHLIINCDCKVQIILLSPDQTEIIKDRVNSCSKYETSTEFSAGQIGIYIVNQIRKLKAISEDLPENKGDYLQVKLYSGNMQASITGYEDIIFAGRYLNNDVAEEGFQEMIEGKSTKAYQVWYHHFLTNWRKAVSI